MNTVNDRSRDIGEFVPAPDDDMLICRCEEITKGEIRRAVHDGMWRNQKIFENGNGTLSGADLCKTCKRNCRKRTRCFTS